MLRILGKIMGKKRFFNFFPKAKGFCLYNHVEVWVIKVFFSFNVFFGLSG